MKVFISHKQHDSVAAQRIAAKREIERLLSDMFENVG